MKINLFPITAAVALAGCTGNVPEPVTAPSPQPVARVGVGTAAGASLDSSIRVPSSSASNLRPYNRVITSEAKTRRGLFSVHRVGERLYFEIPSKELNKDMLIVGRYARAAAADPTLPAGQFGEYG